MCIMYLYRYLFLIRECEAVNEILKGHGLGCRYRTPPVTVNLRLVLGSHKR